MDDRAARMTLTIFRRDGCSVCDEAEDLLNEELDARAARGQAIPSVVHVDITTAPDLEARYGHRIPVFELGDVELDLVVTPGRLRALLDNAAADARATSTSWT